MRKTDGHWGISGPGWAAEWNQGGESGFLLGEEPEGIGQVEQEVADVVETEADAGLADLAVGFELLAGFERQCEGGGAALYRRVVVRGTD